MDVNYFAYGSNLSARHIKQRVREVLEEGLEGTPGESHLEALLGNIKAYERAVDGSRRRAVMQGYHLMFNKVSEGNPGQGFANVMPTGPWVLKVLREGEVFGLEMPRVEGALYTIPHEYFVPLCVSECIYRRPPHYFLKDVAVDVGGRREAATTLAASLSRISLGLEPPRSYLARMLEGADVLSRDYRGGLKRLVDRT